MLCYGPLLCTPLFQSLDPPLAAGCASARPSPPGRARGRAWLGGWQQRAGGACQAPQRTGTPCSAAAGTCGAGRGEEQPPLQALGSARAGGGAGAATATATRSLPFDVASTLPSAMLAASAAPGLLGSRGGRRRRRLLLGLGLGLGQGQGQGRGQVSAGRGSSPVSPAAAPAPAAGRQLWAPEPLTPSSHPLPELGPRPGAGQRCEHLSPPAGGGRILATPEQRPPQPRLTAPRAPDGSGRGTPRAVEGGGSCLCHSMTPPLPPGALGRGSRSSHRKIALLQPARGA